MSKISRRKFLQNSSLAAAGTFLVPQFLKAFDGIGRLQEGENTLVIIQLGGGNDGLNTIVNHGNDLYYQARPALAIPASEVIRLDDMQGLHPALAPLRPLYDKGQFAILNSVGYPDPDRSHFRSMDIWQTGSAAREYLSTGWLGRYLDVACGDCERPTHAIEVGRSLSLALKGQQIKGLAVEDARRFYNTTASPWFKSVSTHHAHTHPHESEAAYLYQTLAESISSAEYIFEKSNAQKHSADYPQGQLAHALKTTGELIAAGIDTRVYYVSLSGFDTHVNQGNPHQRLLTQYAESVAAFAADLRKQGRWNNTLVMTFSEFGRRVGENASRGTDHGTANNLFLMGGALKKPGIYNAAPNLSDLDEGDLKFQLDFRAVYAEILKNWLRTSPKGILGSQHPALGIV